MKERMKYDYENEAQTTINIHFPYFKQGDDFDGCDGDFERFAELHMLVAKIARDINI